MSKQLHKLQEVKKPRRLTHDEMRIHKSKRNTLGFYGISRLGFPPKYPKLSNITIDTKAKNVDKPVQNKKTITKKVHCSSGDYHPLLKSAVYAYLNGDTKQVSLLTNVVVPERTLKRLADIFSEIMDRGDNAIEFEKVQ